MSRLRPQSEKKKPNPLRKLRKLPRSHTTSRVRVHVCVRECVQHVQGASVGRPTHLFSLPHLFPILPLPIPLPLPLPIHPLTHPLSLLLSCIAAALPLSHTLQLQRASLKRTPPGSPTFFPFNSGISSGPPGSNAAKPAAPPPSTTA